MPNTVNTPFDPRLVRLHRLRAAPHLADASFLHTRVADDLAERLEGVNRSFAHVLVIGGGVAFRDAVATHPALTEKIGAVTTFDWVNADVIGDPEHLPFAEQSFELVAVKTVFRLY